MTEVNTCGVLLDENSITRENYRLLCGSFLRPLVKTKITVAQQYERGAAKFVASEI